MFRSRIGEHAQPQLPDMAEPLKLPRVDQIQKQAIRLLFKRDEIVHGIPEFGQRPSPPADSENRCIETNPKFSNPNFFHGHLVPS